ncbi:redoxin domain-containing protein [Nocardioides sp. zg-579]|uniref:Redoxin domain-containing protein n=1 Tax=Nocardioides marmotae TaxID=2663857 RepID=A0A6I3JF90_9ACTN|nr:NHL domain-containing thioredoxin family protein [Nocardioides marmotae]MCR6033135.1 redoxin domain-containing protein [Gordonia jinghuaiqii]MTB96787.1 redoxin domain-containing protein [Nocardioides marmotae]QKE03009.1 redoxin domain-containing protein [Nocardioides marmotae]
MNRTARVRAPELVGRGWLNTDGPLRLADLRGRFVLLDFWTFCCINCLHVLDELKPVEAEHAEELVVIGVHSPKFVHEADPDALRAAVERYSVTHPVLDDPELVTWQAYTARAWPTLVLVDPEGYVVGQYAGEGHAHAIDALLDQLVAEHRAKGTLQPGDSPYVPPVVEPTDLRFPASAVPLPDGRVLVADAGHDEVVELAADGAVLRRFGGFREPNGLCLLPADVAAEVGYDAVVADTVGHRLHGLDTTSGEVRVLAGDGRQWMQGDGTDRLSSPWDVAWWRDRVWVAMAGIHQLWTLDPRTGAVEVAGGTANEGLLDGPLAEAWFAQTSRLAPAGERLWLADSETSAVRWVEEGPAGLEVRTAVGTGLFDFGFRDGPADQALLQHPLGVTVLPDGSVAVCDTYNGAVRRLDPVAGEVTTLAGGLAEPSAAHVDGSDLVVVESGAHRLTRVPLGGAGTRTDGFAHSTQRPVTEVPATLELVVSFTPPPGQKVDDRFGPPAQLLVEATPPQLVREGGGRGTELTRTIVLDPHVGEGVLHVAARAASCDAGGGEGAACHMHQQDWGVPVRLAEGADARLVLPLGGVEG